VNDAAYRGTHVQLELPTLGAGETATLSAPTRDEAVLVLLAGTVVWNGRRAKRSDVFAEPASAVYLPPGASVAVTASTASELAFATTVGCDLTPAGTLSAVSPADVVVHQRGEPGWQRDVHDIVAENVPHAQRMIVGETFNAAGQWSSFPPHKHDGADGEPALEEVYYYRFDKPDGFGFQGLYETNGEERAVFLRHGSVVGIPRGYHPVCAAPGYRLYYLWALVGEPRALAMHEDPAHTWMKSR
jgi:5-deoxy-glucuronate isomerase